MGLGPSPLLFPPQLLVRNQVPAGVCAPWTWVITLCPPTCGPALGPLSSARVPAARGLTLSAGSEISLHQVNCQTAQSLKLNFKAVAPRHRAIPPHPPRPSKRQFCLSKHREDGFPRSGRYQDGAAGDSPHRCNRTSPQHSPGSCCCWAGQNLEPQMVLFPEVSFLLYLKG